MIHKATKLFATLALLTVGAVTFAQEYDDPAEQKKFDESLEKSVEHYETILNLEDWQVFYVDSIMRHDFTALREEFNELSKAKVSNADIYVQVQDKWQEQMYNAFRKVLDDEQWTKYLKAGAARDKKARDKRAAKLQGKQN